MRRSSFCYEQVNYAACVCATLAGATTAAMAAAATAGGAGQYDSDEEVYAAARAVDQATAQYDADDRLALGAKKDIEALAPLEHGDIEYEDFAKDFYEQAAAISAMGDAEVAAYRKQLSIRVGGFDAPRPIQSFQQCGFDASLLNALKKAGVFLPALAQRCRMPLLY